MLVSKVAPLPLGLLGFVGEKCPLHFLSQCMGLEYTFTSLSTINDRVCTVTFENDSKKCQGP